MNILVSRRSALIGAAALTILAACTNADGTKMSARQVLQDAVRIAKGAVSLAKILLAGFDANCAQNPASNICTNAVIVAAVLIGRPALIVLGDALSAADAALANNTTPEDAIGTALGKLLSAQQHVQDLIDALADKKTAQNSRMDFDDVRFQAQRLGITPASLAFLPR